MSAPGFYSLAQAQRVTGLGMDELVALATQVDGTSMIPMSIADEIGRTRAQAARKEMLNQVPHAQRKF